MLTRSAIGVGSLLLFSAALFACASSTSDDTGTVLDGAVTPQDSGTGEDSTVADSAPADTYIAFDTGTTGPGTGPTSCSQTNGTFGCCGPNGENYYCGADAGTVSSKNCAAEVTDAGTALVCGWNATKGYYGCVPPPAVADPSGAEPRRDQVLPVERRADERIDPLWRRLGRRRPG